MTKTKKVLIVIGFLILGYIALRYAWHYGTVAYFKYKCETYGGEFIYKTVDDVEGLYQMRLRDPRDYFDRLSNHDIPEDPYGHTNWEAQNPETLFVAKKRGFLFLETQKFPNLNDRRYPKAKLKNTPEFTGEKYWRYSLKSEGEQSYLLAEQTSALKSKYGFTWREVRSPLDKLFGVWVGELLVIKLDTNEELAVRRGYFYRGYFSGRLRVCPEKGYAPTLNFLRKVLNPINTTKFERKPQ